MFQLLAIVKKHDTANQTILCCLWPQTQSREFSQVLSSWLAAAILSFYKHLVETLDLKQQMEANESDQKPSNRAEAANI